jgi:hypothetical protein
MEYWGVGKNKEKQPTIYSWALPILQHSNTPMLQFDKARVSGLSQEITKEA